MYIPLTKSQQITLGILVFILIVLISYQIYHLSDNIDRIFYSALLLFFICALQQEKIDKDKNIEGDYACRETERVAWRRALIISFPPLVIMNTFFLQNFRVNLLYFLLSLGLTYFYFNYDAFHRALPYCKENNLLQTDK